MNEPQLSAEERQVRAEACRALARQLDAAAELVGQLDLSGWERHFKRDAEMLRLRAQNEEEPPE